jgi:hypothetical protein
MPDFPSWKAVETLYQIEELDWTEGLEIRIVHAYISELDRGIFYDDTAAEQQELVVQVEWGMGELLARVPD